MCNKTQSPEEYRTAEELKFIGESRRDKDIQQAKKWLNKQKIKKSGYNKSLKYKYYEFEDFIGYVLSACEQFDLSTHFSMETILPGNVERPKTKRNEADQMPTFVGIASLEVKSLHYHEPRITRVPFNFQVVHTDTGTALSYAKRYAYMIAFDISDADMVEATNISTDQKPEQNMSSNQHHKIEQSVSKTMYNPLQEQSQNHVQEEDDDSWKKNEFIKSLHTKMTKRSPKAYLDKKTTQKFAQLEYEEGHITKKQYNDVKTLLTK